MLDSCALSGMTKSVHSGDLIQPNQYQQNKTPETAHITPQVIPRVNHPQLLAVGKPLLDKPITERHVNHSVPTVERVSINGSNAVNLQRGELDFYTFCIFLSFIKYPELINESSGGFLGCCPRKQVNTHKNAVENMEKIELLDNCNSEKTLSRKIVMFASQQEDAFCQLAHPSLLLRNAPQILGRMSGVFIQQLEQHIGHPCNMKESQAKEAINRFLQERYVHFLQLLTRSQTVQNMCAKSTICLKELIRREVISAPNKLLTLVPNTHVSAENIKVIRSHFDAFLQRLDGMDENQDKKILKKYEQLRKVSEVRTVRKLAEHLPADQQPFARVQPSPVIYNFSIALRWAQLELKIQQTQNSIYDLGNVSGHVEKTLVQALKNIKRQLMGERNQILDNSSNPDQSFQQLRRELEIIIQSLEQHYVEANRILQDAQALRTRTHGAGVPLKLINEMTHGKIISINELDTMKRCLEKLVSKSLTNLRNSSIQCDELLMQHTTNGNRRASQ